MKKDKIIQKQAELINWLSIRLNDLDSYNRYNELTWELGVLQSEPEEEGYPEKFVEWLCFGSHPFVRWFDEQGDYFTDEITPQRWNIPELFEFWKLNIKDKKIKL